MIGDKVSIVYSSKDRPLQLDFAISSNKYCCKDWDKFSHYIIYKATNDRFKKAYDTLKKEHEDCVFIQEGNYKQDLLNIVIQNDYVVFSVDDVIYTTDYFMEDAVNKLGNNPFALGFSLRMGKNTTYCYSQDKQHIMPIFSKVSGKVLKYNWLKELSIYNGDFGFPLEVSGSLYRARDLLFILYNTNWENPNTLEGALYYNLRGLSYMPEMLLYKTSLCFCNPINKVFLQGNNNRTGNNDKYSVENLLKMYEDGYRIPVNKCYGFVPNACHQEVELF